MPRLSKIGAACLSAFGFGTGGAAAVTASYLVVAGGGGGQTTVTNIQGGGGGAGGLLTGTTSLSLTQTYTVVVGAGGANTATNGSNSTAFSLTAIGGGFGRGSDNVSAAGSGGSGGGSSGGAVGTGTTGQGNNGGTVGGAPGYGGGGGGGAGATGGSGSGTSGGAGGIGVQSSITGTATYYAGGGGGGVYNATGGAGGLGGGGAGASGGATATAGTANLGGGGGNSNNGGVGGRGGSGVVIVAYAGAQKFGGGIVSSDGTNTIHTFKTSGQLVPMTPITASYLIVAGGGSGGNAFGGGGGAGGLLTGLALTIDPSSTYLVTVGAGAASSTSNGAQGTTGSNSSFSMVSTSAVGGGGGGGYNSGGNNGQSGGSGGGGSGDTSSGTSPSTGGSASPSGQGNAGGNGYFASTYLSGGGGGAGQAGGTFASGTISGYGGNGSTSSISGTETYYAGGGGGGGNAGLPRTQGAGGLGGGGAGGYGTAGVAGTANTGGGGGGGSGGGYNAGGAGGSGVVVISYAGTTQLMAGGTVTIVGGNVIHTFTSSGYLTPLTFIGRSLRFRSSASASLTRTPTVAGNRKTFTWSAWVKRGLLGSSTYELSRCYIDTNNTTTINFGSDVFNFLSYSGGAGACILTTSQVFRDPAAWYHVVVSIDTTQATASNRAKLFVNGNQVTAFSTATYPSQNADLTFNTTNIHRLGAGDYPSFPQYFDGYLADVRFIDGQALTPNSFGTFNSYGVWQPINYGGSYGTNGFHLPFSDTTSTTTLCYDKSPQGNNWTPNNISLTSGSTYDSMTDVPTLTSATAANYAVLNPLDKGAIDLTTGNLTFQRTSSTTDWEHARASMQLPTTGKWYWECKFNSGSNDGIFNGVATSTANLSTDFAGGTYAGMYGYSSYQGAIFNNNSSSTLGSSLSNGDVIMIAVDVANTNLWIGVNGTWLGSGNPATNTNASIGSIPLNVHPVCGSRSTGNGSVNFGQQPWAYTPPTGFVALNTYNM